MSATKNGSGWYGDAKEAGMNSNLPKSMAIKRTRGRKVHSKIRSPNSRWANIDIEYWYRRIVLKCRKWRGYKRFEI